MKLNLIALFLLLFVGVVHAQLPTNFEETTLVSPSDSLELSVLIAYPETEPIAVVQLVHAANATADAFNIQTNTLYLINRSEITHAVYNGSFAAFFY